MGIPKELHGFKHHWESKESHEYRKWLFKSNMAMTLMSQYKGTLQDHIRQLGFNTWESLEKEFKLIEEKKSELNRRNRDKVKRVYNLIKNKTQ